ncbi:MAG: UDP-N-acetylenolpyruvoylglucosamine reductase, partial [Candidatus Methylomirabilales bacterium]
GAFGGAIADRLMKLRLITSSGEELILDRKNLAFSYRRSSLPEGSVIIEAAFALTKGDPLAIRRRILELLVQRNRSQPVELRSCGSVFKNPPGDYAGRLIEAAGLKGFRRGDAQISPKHGNFIVNLGGAKAGDVLALIEVVKDRVKKEQGVELELEVKVVGED